MSEALYDKLRRLTPIPNEQFHQFAQLLRRVTLAKDEHFIIAGDIPTDFGFVTKGVFRFYYIDYNGNECVKTLCTEGEFIAAYSALLRNEPSALFIQALEESELLLINFHDYTQLQHHCWIQLSKTFAEQLYMKKEEREREFLLYDAETRYKRFLERYPTLERRIKHYHIASFLGITPVSLSRIRKKMTGH